LQLQILHVDQGVSDLFYPQVDNALAQILQIDSLQLIAEVNSECGTILNP
jgi:hypothetical protein